ncbi:uncharacterized protein LOC106383573 [Brassica napus]|uniref:uncharacterized protein LOC106383573 n=1 Tax=Brassica napus TaxID=3708 RepID=UPI0006AB61F9|nr:uncharacterized protein LOC106383573 [Brassica napus]
MGRTNFSDEERDAGYCWLFIESLQGPALGWFTGLGQDSINDFHDLTSAFLKQYVYETRSDLIQPLEPISGSEPKPPRLHGEVQNCRFEVPVREDLYRNPTNSLQDAITRSNNFIRMEEDTSAILKKMNAAAKQTTAPKALEARQEPRQHATCNKPNQQKSFVYIVEDKNPPPGSTVVVCEKGWNIWENDEKPQTSSAPSTLTPGPTEPNLWCSFHKSKAHDTRNCRQLVDVLFSSYENRTANVGLPKPRQNNTKSWRKNKEKKAHKNQDKAGARPKRAEDDKPEEQDEDEGEAQIEEEQPRNY